MRLLVVVGASYYLLFLSLLFTPTTYCVSDNVNVNVNVNGNGNHVQSSSTTPTKDTAFFSAARIGDEATLKEYLQKGIDVSSRDSKGNTAIIIAAGRGQANTIKLLLQFGANIEDATIGGLFDGKTVLMWAVSQGRSEVINLLINAKVDVNKVTDRGVFLGKTALCWAASQGRSELVSVLLAAGAAIDYSSPIGNFRGKTALMWSSSQGRYDAVQVLLEAGAGVNKEDHDGVTALMWACGSETKGDSEHSKGLLIKGEKGNILADTVGLLLSYRSTIDARDKDGITPIMYAAFQGHDEVVSTLIRSGADLTYQNKAGQTATQLARQANHNSTVHILSGVYEHPFSSLPLPELLKIPTCGWLLSIFRSYSRHRSLYFPNGDSGYSVSRSCAHLDIHGLDGRLDELVEIVLVSSVEEVVSYFGVMSFANKVRVKSELKKIAERVLLSSVVSNGNCNDNSSSSSSGGSRFKGNGERSEECNVSDEDSCS